MPKKSRIIYIYGTVFNNATTVERAIQSIIPLKPLKIFIVDNFSNDNTFEIIRNSKLNLKVKIQAAQAKCTRGLGRNIALEMALAEARDDDVLMYMDFDVKALKLGLRIIKKRLNNIKSNQISIFNHISLALTNKELPWLDLNAGEDFERLARAKSLGYKILDIKNMLKYTKRNGYKNLLFDNASSLGSYGVDREVRYAKNKFKLTIRLFKILIDTERGIAYQSLKEFYSTSKVKKYHTLIAYAIAYFCAKIKGVYSYSKLPNNKYVLK